MFPFYLLALTKKNVSFLELLSIALISCLHILQICRTLTDNVVDLCFVLFGFAFLGTVELQLALSKIYLTGIYLKG